MVSKIISRALGVPLTLLLIAMNSDNPDRGLFISPVRIPILLSANFAEIRSDHFHSGIDIRTQGVTGHEIVAAASGYVYRIGVSPGGFGKALYLRHPSGYSTVYAHLDRFIPEIEEYVTGQQYQNRSFAVNLFPPEGRFVFRQGQLIAFSGNTGSSSGPHLHYEIRKSDNEMPLDPLKFEFGVKDNIKPLIESLVVYPMDKTTAVNGKNEDILLAAQGSHGSFYIRSDRPITVSGRAGFGIRTHDYLNDSWNKCGVYSIEMMVDGQTIYHFEMDRFSFDETRYVNSHIDYKRKVRDNVTIQQTFAAPNDKLSAYKTLVNRGVFDFRTDTTHTIRIVVTDSHLNSSALVFRVQSQSDGHMPDQAGSNNTRLLQYNRQYRMADGDISVSIPENSFYDNIEFKFSRSERPESLYADIFTIMDRFTPIHKAYKLSVKPVSIPEGLKGRMAIVSLNGNGRPSYVGGEWSGDFLAADLRSFGSFSVGIDTVPPEIVTNGFTSGTDLTGRRELRFNISDDFSGIKSYEAFIDEKWALFEYDPKNSVIVHRFDPKRTEKGKMHTLLLRVTDNRNNVAEFSAEFRW